ncbi:putative ATPase [Nitrobacteraceae bacterium AZCC 2161]
MARRHAIYYRDLFERAEKELETLAGPAWLARYGHQIGQVRAALDWAFLPTGDAEVGAALTVGAMPLWVHLSLMEECRGRVERALSRPTESRDARRNMQLHATLGAALFLTKGSCPEMVAAWTRVFEIAESLDDADYRLRALWGLWIDCFTSGRYQAALAVAERFCLHAAKSTDPADGLIGNRLVGVALLVLGDLKEARRHIERMLGRYVARKSHIIRFQYDQRLLAHSHHSRILWLQGFAEQAIRNVERLVVDAHASGHPLSLANAHLQSALVVLLVGDLTLTERYVKALLELSARHALESLVGRCFGSVLLIKRGDIGAGLELLRTAFASVPHNAFSMLFTPFRAEMADALGREGKAAEGLSIIEEALARSERNEERWCVAELLRIKGELLLREGTPQAATAAEEHFLQSLDWARRQGALSWELRTSTSLARLQHDQGRIAEARSLLQSVYDRFSEGFETADLKAAKAYLNFLM